MLVKSLLEPWVESLANAIRPGQAGWDLAGSWRVPGSSPGYKPELEWGQGRWQDISRAPPKYP